jgi:hypothetical protein
MAGRRGASSSPALPAPQSVGTVNECSASHFAMLWGSRWLGPNLLNKPGIYTFTYCRNKMVYNVPTQLPLCWGSQRRAGACQTWRTARLPLHRAGDPSQAERVALSESVSAQSSCEKPRDSWWALVFQFGLPFPPTVSRWCLRKHFQHSQGR